MKLQSQISRIYNEKEYIKFWIVIPSKIMKELTWKKEDSLQLIRTKNEIVVKLKEKK